MACYSVLKPAQDVLLARGWYAPAGVNGAQYAAELLSVSPTPIEVDDGAPALASAYIAEDNETNLSMALKLINAINWRLRITGDGVIRICPRSTEISGTYSSLENDVIESELTVSYDWFTCPNVFRAIQGDTYAIARDDAEESPYSTVNRGREIWAQETSCKLANNESLADYAIRRLKELQNVVRSLSYDRRFDPNVTVSDLVQLRYPAQGINGIYEVMGQSIDLSTGAKTSEEVENYGD